MKDFVKRLIEIIDRYIYIIEWIDYRSL
jgi:hypothetical protein